MIVWGGLSMERCLSQDEIRRLEDKNLQLRYLLGGLNTQEI